MHETTQLIAGSKKYTDICTDDSISHDSPPQHFFDSVRHSVRSISNTVTQHIHQIGFLGSLAIATNSLTGPAMLCLPATFQRSGVIPTIGMMKDSMCESDKS